jgi:hypothetical protein
MSTIEKKSLKVGKYVNTEHVDKVIGTYKRERWAHNSKRIGKEDSLSAWYSVEEMENYLANVKANGGNGVRIYFAAYPEDYTAVPEYAGRQTLVMVATKTKVLETGRLAHKEIYVAKENGTPQILAYNAPYLCPPFCPPPPGMGRTKNLGVTIVDNGEGLSVI